MKVNLIIGAGQLGSRHLQGLLKYPEAQVLHVLDPSATSLGIAKERAAEVAHQHQIEFVIVATAANVRFLVVSRLLTEHNVRFLILEKVLFQKVVEYQTMDELLTKYKVPTWVNHPRRMFSHYLKIQGDVKNQTSKLAFSAIGSNWGLACNGLHFIDVFSFLSDSALASLDLEAVDNVIQNSKRPNFYEFTGSLQGRMKNGATFTISSFDDDISAISVTVGSPADHYIIQEGGTPQIIHLSKINAFKANIEEFAPVFQSSLTATLADTLFRTSTCMLPTYNDAKAAHIIFIKAFLEKYNAISGANSDSCPIT
jgi:predicted dehydrogenase